MFHTLQDFTATAKGNSYWLAGLLLLVFIPFWLFLNKKVTRNKK